MKHVSPPGGEPPPEWASLHGVDIELAPLALEVSQRFCERTPEYQARYGLAAAAWCVHDAKYKLAWAAWSADGWHDIAREISWLAGVLEARDFPLRWLTGSLEVAIEVVAERLPAVAAQAMIDQLQVARRVVLSRPQGSVAQEGPRAPDAAPPGPG